MQIFLVYLKVGGASGDDDQYNYGLGYIAAVLKMKGHQVDYIVLKTKRDIANLYEKIVVKQPGIIGFSLTTYHFNHLGNIVGGIKKISHAFIVAGGYHPTLSPESMFSIPGIDAIVRGEGEFALLELVEALEGTKDHLTIKNCWFRHESGVVKNPLRPVIENLDDLPFPDKSSLDYQRAIDDARGGVRYIFSRGCTFNCTYCSNKALSDLYGRTYYRLRSPKKAIEEIGLDSTRYRFDQISFDDDTIHLDKEWFYQFFDLYKKTFKYPFNCNIRADLIEPDMVKLLKDAGITEANIGVEHGNEALRRIHLNRGMSNQKIVETFMLFDRLNVKCFAHLMVGLPFETKNLYLDTVKLCRQLPLNANQGIGIFYPYPSTELGRLCERNGWLPTKKYYRERKEATISYPGFTKKEIELCKNVFPAFLWLKFMPLNTPLSVMYMVLLIYKALKKMKEFLKGENREPAGHPARNGRDTVTITNMGESHV